MPVSSQDFRNTLSTFPSGVTIVTTRTPEGKPYGLTVSAFSSVSLDPPLVLICLNNRASGLEAFRQSGTFGVNILSRDQRDLSTHFATPGTDRTRADYESGATGVPLIRDSLARLECVITARYAGGDHTILLASVEAAEVLNEDGAPLIYYGGSYRDLA